MVKGSQTAFPRLCHMMRQSARASVCFVSTIFCHLWACFLWFTVPAPISTQMLVVFCNVCLMPSIVLVSSIVCSKSAELNSLKVQQLAKFGIKSYLWLWCAISSAVSLRSAAVSCLLWHCRIFSVTEFDMKINHRNKMIDCWVIYLLLSLPHHRIPMSASLPGSWFHWPCFEVQET